MASEKLQLIAKEIKNNLPEGMGFALLVYEFGDANDRKILYVSNSSREDVSKAMLEFAMKMKEDTYGKDVE